MMKKIVSGLLALCMACVLSACTGENHNKTLVVGSEQFSGYFLPSEGFTNTVSDETIRTLLHGGETITLDENGELIVYETNIKEWKREAAENGDVTYTVTLADLTWSDGTAITADDYLFAFLLAASPAYGAAGAVDATGEGLLGYWDYYDGVSEYFKGLQRISDTSFSMTINHEELPYYWELMYLSVNPYPMHVLISEQESILSDEQGVKFNGDMEQAVSRFTNEYNQTQSPSCGAYTLSSYESGQVTLKRNPNYAGDLHGNVPVMEEIIVKEVNEETAMKALINQEIDILEPIMEKERIEEGNEAVEQGSLQRVDFERNGYGVMTFKSNLAPTNEVEVRRAISYLIDRNQLLKDTVGSYGEVIDSDYAPSQWMAKESDDLTMPYAYGYSLAKANEQLNLSSYRFEADGTTPFDSSRASRDYIRYNAKKEPLRLRHLAIDGNKVSDLIEAQLMDHCAKAGIAYQMERTDEAGLQEAYYLASEQGLKEEYQLFTLGTEFASIPDPYYASLACEFADTSANPGNFCDPKLDELMQNMRHSDPMDKGAFLNAWKSYLTYFNEVVPQLPLYTSTYAGFANADLKGYHPTTYHNWASMIADLVWK